MSASAMNIFAACPPGLEDILLTELHNQKWTDATALAGGVAFAGSWHDVWRANLVLRGATRILVRIGSFRAFHPAQLDKRARKFDWGAYLRPDVPVRVEATSRRSKIYHAGAAKQRVERAISEELGAPISAEAAVTVKVRIEDDLVTLSLDSSGESLHKRGHKEAVAKAPMRETLAHLFLRKAGFDGEMAAVDPMCGSGTFVIEAAEQAMGLYPGRSRQFAFQEFATFDPDVWADLRAARAARSLDVRFFGSDRNSGAIEMARANAARAGVDAFTRFSLAPITELERPDVRPGLLIVNPPYGARIGNKKLLFGLYGALGQVLKERFTGWKVGIVTSDRSLARATGLPKLTNSAPIPHGGLKVQLFESQL